MVKRGDIYLINNGKYGYKPAIIIQNDNLNATSEYVVALKLTRTPKIESDIHCKVVSYAPDAMTSTAVCDQIYTVKKLSLGKHMGRISDEELAMIDRHVKKVLGLGV